MNHNFIGMNKTSPMFRQNIPFCFAVYLKQLKPIQIKLATVVALKLQIKDT